MINTDLEYKTKMVSLLIESISSGYQLAIQALSNRNQDEAIKILMYEYGDVMSKITISYNNLLNAEKDKEQS